MELERSWVGVVSGREGKGRVGGSGLTQGKGEGRGRVESGGGGGASPAALARVLGTESLNSSTSTGMDGARAGYRESL